MASIDKHIIRFHIPYLKWFYDSGYEVHVACNGNAEIPYCEVRHQIDFIRSPFSLDHIKVYFQFSSLLKEHVFVLIHCHTAVASIITRFAARTQRKNNGLKVFYTAHGFHFFKGSPWYYWAIFYPIERFFSKFTDCIITINSEDYELATEKFHCKDVRRVCGMGVNGKMFGPVDSLEKLKLRNNMGLSPDSKVIIYTAEFIKRKNHEFLIRCSKELKVKFPDLIILLPGRGRLHEKMRELAISLGVSDFVYFLGFRDDIHKLLALSDIAVSTSKQEGLGLHIVEAMMCGLTVVATKDRGHREILNHEVNGYLFDQGDKESFIHYIDLIFSNDDLCKELSLMAIQTAHKFDLEIALDEMAKIYHSYL